MPITDNFTVLFRLLHCNPDRGGFGTTLEQERADDFGRPLVFIDRATLDSKSSTRRTDRVAPHGDTDNDTLPLCERGGGVAPPPTTPPTGTGSLLLEELAPSGPAHRDHGEGPPLQPELHHPPGQSTLIEDHWQRIPADVRNRLGLPQGTGAVQEWVLSNAARQDSSAQEEATRAHTDALATAEAAHAKAATSHTAAEGRMRAAAEEKPRIMRE